MATSSGRAFEIVGTCLLEFNCVLRFFVHFMHVRFPQSLTPVPTFASLCEWDTARLLGEILNSHRELFCGPAGDDLRLVPSEFSLLYEVRRVRNEWAHQHLIDEASAYRSLDCMTTFVEVVLRMAKSPHSPDSSSASSPAPRSSRPSSGPSGSSDVALHLAPMRAAIRTIHQQRDVLVLLLAESRLAASPSLASAINPADFPALRRAFSSDPSPLRSCLDDDDPGFNHHSPW